MALPFLGRIPGTSLLFKEQRQKKSRRGLGDGHMTPYEPLADI